MRDKKALKRFQFARRPPPLNAFEGDPDPSEIEGKRIHVDLLDAMASGFGADVKPGDVVICSKYVHTEVRVGDEMCRIIPATDILAVLEETEQAA